MSEDEFDNLPDEFADVQGVDWAQLLAGPSHAADTRSSGQFPLETGQQQSAIPSVSSQSNNDNSFSSYFSDDDMDSSFLAELDRVEQRITQAAPASLPGGGITQPQLQDAALQTSRSGGASSVTQVSGNSIAPQPQLRVLQEVRSSHYFGNQTAGRSSSSPQKLKEVETGDFKQASSVPCKRAHSEDSSNLISPKRKGKMKADDEIQQIFSTYEDELTCPICCDIFVASHVGNPCGHTFCGECGWQWHVQNGNKGCPCCRRNLNETMPMIPNISMDNTVEKHVRALALSGVREWEPDGQKYLEWEARKLAWRKGAAKRERNKARQAPKPVVSVGTFQVFDIFHIEDNVDEDPTHEDSDVELIPRPIQRARRRRRGGVGPMVVNAG